MALAAEGAMLGACVCRGSCITRWLGSAGCTFPHSPRVAPGQNPASANAESIPRSNHSLVRVPNRSVFKTGVRAELTLSAGKFPGGASLGHRACAQHVIIDGARLPSAGGTSLPFRLVMRAPSSPHPHQKSPVLMQSDEQKCCDAVLNCISSNITQSDHCFICIGMICIYPLS